MDDWELCPDIPHPNQIVELTYLSAVNAQRVTKYYTTIKKAEAIARELHNTHKAVDLELKAYHVPGLRALKGANPEGIVRYYLNALGRRRLAKHMEWRGSDRALAAYFSALDAAAVAGGYELEVEETHGGER